MSTASLTIDGMTCASCVARVERALKAAPGVSAATVNLVTHAARVEYAPTVTSPSDLAAAVAKAGYAATPAVATATGDTADHQREETLLLRRDALIAAALTAPVLILAMGTHMVPAFHHLVMRTIGTEASWLVQFVLATLVLVWPGRRFFSHGIPALLRGAPDMNSLVALGASAAWAYSTVATLAPGLLPEVYRVVYFESAATIVTFILIGRWLEGRAKGAAGEALRRLIDLRPATARVRRGDSVSEIAVAALAPGDTVLVNPGERVAVDGILAEGRGFIDESMLTGESIPVAKGPGDPVTGGTVNGNSALAYRVTAVGADTTLSRIVAMVSEAQATKLPVQAMVDRITLWFVPAVMTAAVLAFAGWWVLGPDPRLTHALVAGISVLIIACPCAMGLATPVSVLVGTGRGAEKGLLFRRGDALQLLSGAATIAFDKTGTLTLGHPAVTDLMAGDDSAAAAVLRLAAAAESRSDHPIARAILAEAAARGLSVPPASDAEALPGLGLTAMVEGKSLRVGSRRALQDAGIDCDRFTTQIAALSAQGKTPVLVAIDGRAEAVMGIADPVKPTARAAVAELLGMGLDVAMISGDARTTAEAVARELGITTVRAEVMPGEKVAAIRALRASGPVAFVGDGINDAPALAAADVGIAIGTGTDVAIESAEVVAMSGDPAAIATAIRLSRAVLRNIRQNLFWAFGYNVILIPVAAGALYPLTGQMLSPLLAAAAMGLSSVFVVSNALRLRRA